MIACCTILHNICVDNRDFVTLNEASQGDPSVCDDFESTETTSQEDPRDVMAARMSAPNTQETESSHLSDHSYFICSQSSLNNN